VLDWFGETLDAADTLGVLLTAWGYGALVGAMAVAATFLYRRGRG